MSESETHESITRRTKPPMPRDQALDKYMAQAKRYPLREKQEERELLRRYQETGDLRLRDKVVLANLRLVVKIAHGFNGYGMGVEDFVGAGNIGLLKACDKFELAKKTKFSTYAAFWIKAYMNKFALKNWSIVMAGASHPRRTLFFRVRSEAKRLAHKLERPITSEEIAESLQVPLRDVLVMRVVMQGRDFSLDAPLTDDVAGASTFIDNLAGDVPSIEEEYMQKDMREKVRACIDNLRPSLTEREQAILDRRLMPEHDREILESIGDTFGVCRERVRQNEKRLKPKIAMALKAAGLAPCSF